MSPGKCVLLSTSKSVRRAVKHWDISGDGKAWKVLRDVRDLGGHLDFTKWAGAGTLSDRVRDAALGVVAVGALPLGFQVELGLVRGNICLLVCMLLRLLMCLLLPLAVFGLPLLGPSGLIRAPCQHSGDS